MYRTYVQSSGEKVTSNRLVQVLENNTIADFPKIKKGITFKAPKVNDYLKGDNALNKIDGNKILTVVENVLHIAKFENQEFTEIESIELEKKSGINYKSKIVSLTKNKSVIVYSNGGNNGSIVCCAVHIDEASNIMQISDSFVITSSTGNLNIDVAVLSSNKIVVGYLEKADKTNSNLLAKTPVFSVINISQNNKITMLQKPIQVIEKEEKEEALSVSMVYVTKISEDEFFGTYVFKGNVFNKSIVLSTVFKINSNDVISKHQTLEYQGYYNDFEAKAIKPFYLDNYRIITFEFINGFDFKMVLREIKQDLSTGVYAFDTLSSVKPNVYYPYRVHNIDLLRINNNGSRDFVLFNQQIFSIDVLNNNITILGYFQQYLTANISSYKMNILPTINLENNLLLTLDDENNFQMIKYDDYNGEILGIVKEGVNNE